MNKITLGPKSLLCPLPTVLVGVHVDKTPNFMAVAWCGIAGAEPPMITFALRPRRYSYTGIKQNMMFSVNIPSADLVKETDYCGITSGRNIDKTAACQFKVFYGKLENAPLIEQCPVNLECKVMHILDLGSHSLVVGRIEEVHISESCINNGQVDFGKINPIIYLTDLSNEYRAIGEIIGRAFDSGKQLKTRG